MKPAETAKMRFGIVATGMIAGVVAEAIGKARNAKLVAVSSRSLENAERFVATRPGVAAVEGADGLINRDDIDAIYIASPTAAKEAIALAAIAAGKHVLIDKPHANYDSIARMIAAAAAKRVFLMDATHFVHHPRTPSAASSD